MDQNFEKEKHHQLCLLFYPGADLKLRSYDQTVGGILRRLCVAAVILAASESLHEWCKVSFQSHFKCGFDHKITFSSGLSHPVQLLVGTEQQCRVSVWLTVFSFVVFFLLIILNFKFNFKFNLLPTWPEFHVS